MHFHPRFKEVEFGGDIFPCMTVSVASPVPAVICR